MLSVEIYETTLLMYLAPENPIPQSRRCHRSSSWLGLCLLLSVLLARQAFAEGEEPLLWLAVQRGQALDRVASELVREQLVSRKDFKIVESTLADTDRRCRTSPCLAALARQHQAFVVLSGDVFQVGSKQNQRVVMHLYDGRHRQVFDVENLCTDCDETKLGLLIQSTVSEIIGRYRKGQDADAQLNELLDGAAKSGPPAIPAPSADPVMVPPLLATPPSLASTPAQLAVPAQQPSVSRPQLAPMPATRAVVPPPAQLAHTSVGALPANIPAGALPPLLPPSPIGNLTHPTTSEVPQLPGGAIQYQQQPGSYQQLSPSTSQRAQPIQQDSVNHRGLSGRRKALAAVFGSLGFAILGGSIAAHYYDKKLDSSLAVNPSGMPCTATTNAGQSCVLTTIGLWAPGYAVSGLMIGGMILSLAVPEK